jgi:hypothetical protein
VQKIIETERGCAAFPIREYWLDIGQIDDYNKLLEGGCRNSI